jgi:TusA-related sulfurtransferase
MKALDLQGLACPLPVLRTNKYLKDMAPGETLRLLVSDAAAPEDFRKYCESTGHALIEISEQSGVYAIVLRKRQD